MIDWEKYEEEYEELYDQPQTKKIVKILENKKTVFIPLENKNLLKPIITPFNTLSKIVNNILIIKIINL